MRIYAIDTRAHIIMRYYKYNKSDTMFKRYYIVLRQIRVKNNKNMHNEQKLLNYYDKNNKDKQYY